MKYDNFDKIRRLQAKQRELERELEEDDTLEDEYMVIAEIDRIEKEIMRLSEGRYF